MARNTEKQAEQDHQDALAAQATINDPASTPAEDRNVDVRFVSTDAAYEQGYQGESPARAAAGGKADKGLSQQSLLNQD